MFGTPLSKTEQPFQQCTQQVSYNQPELPMWFHFMRFKAMAIEACYILIQAFQSCIRKVCLFLLNFTLIVQFLSDFMCLDWWREFHIPGTQRRRITVTLSLEIIIAFSCHSLPVQACGFCKKQSVPQDQPSFKKDLQS